MFDLKKTLRSMSLEKSITIMTLISRALWSYVFNSSNENKYIGLLLIYTRTTDISNIHCTHWPFILTRNDKYAYTINTCQCKPQQIEELKTKASVNPHTIKKHKNTDIFIHTHFSIWSMFLTLTILNVWFKKDA